jgi:acetyl-CoA carboxylase biotin carboxylase subunit
MICKLIAHGEDRAAAIQTMINALKTFEIKGIKTTIPLHLEILAAKFFNEGNYNTGSLSTLLR